MFIDHFVWVAPDLRLEMERFQDLAGVKPEFGGSHPGKGTHNALLRIAEATYLEILAPDPLQPELDRRWMMREYPNDSHLIKWAWSSTNIPEDSRRMNEMDCPVGRVSTGKRLTDDGHWLHWQLTDPDYNDSFLVPFLIQWNNDQPTRSLPHLCQLRSIRISHARPSDLRFINLLLDFPGIITEGAELLILEIDSPGGIIQLSTQPPYFQVI